MFSPYYAWAGRRDPLNHCALNVALYGGVKRWAMTERGRGRVAVEPARFAVGPSAMAWDGTALTVEIDEIAVPRLSRIRGRVRLRPEALTEEAHVIDGAGRHLWWPVAPCARIEVELERPSLAWSGHGYFDTNAGYEPLEAGFRSWTWCRARRGPDAAVLYDATWRDGTRRMLALRFDGAGRAHAIEAPPAAALPGTLWRVDRAAVSEDGRAELLDTLEDAPFYARSLVSTRLLGERASAVHESLSLARFATRWVKLLLPFRMPRDPRRGPIG